MKAEIDLILSRLSPGFEQDLFRAAIASFKEVDNVLRLNNFAHSIHQLMSHYLCRLAPDQQVKATAWYKPVRDERGRETVTIFQRIRYVMQGYLCGDSMAEYSMSFDDFQKELDRHFTDLDTFSHITEKSFGVSQPEADIVYRTIINDLLWLMVQIGDAQCQAACDMYYLIKDDLAVECILDQIADYDFGTDTETEKRVTVTSLSLSDDGFKTISDVKGNILLIDPTTLDTSHPLDSVPFTAMLHVVCDDFGECRVVHTELCVGGSLIVVSN